MELDSSTPPHPPVFDFEVFNCEPVTQNIAGLSRYQQSNGLYVQEGDQYYVEFMRWEQRRMGGEGKRPDLLLYRHPLLLTDLAL